MHGLGLGLRFRVWDFRVWDVKALQSSVERSYRGCQGLASTWVGLRDLSTWLLQLLGFGFMLCPTVENIALTRPSTTRKKT